MTDINRQVQYWAHMLDESFGDQNDNNISLPKGKDAKFVVKNVFPDQMFKDDSTENLKKVLERFTQIWPDWEKEINDYLNTDQEIDGRQIDVDDFDVWKIYPAQFFNEEDVANLLYDVLAGNEAKEFQDKETTASEIIDVVCELLDEKLSNIDLSEIEDKGQCIWRGTYKTGGYYPDH